MISQADRDRLEDLGLDPNGDHTEDMRPQHENGPSTGGNRLAEANVPTPRA